MKNIDWKALKDWHVSSNFIFYPVAGVAHFIAGNIWLALFIGVLLTIASGVYHYGEEIGSPSWGWRLADNSMIYLIAGIYPYELTGQPIMLMMMLPALFAVGWKAKLYLRAWKPSSLYVVGTLFLPTAVFGATYVPTQLFIVALLSFGIAIVNGRVAEKHPKQSEIYSRKHGNWHQWTAIGFIALS